MVSVGQSWPRGCSGDAGLCAGSTICAPTLPSRVGAVGDQNVRNHLIRHSSLSSQRQTTQLVSSSMGGSSSVNCLRAGMLPLSRLALSGMGKWQQYPGLSKVLFCLALFCSVMPFRVSAGPWITNRSFVTSGPQQYQSCLQARRNHV